MLDGLNGAEGTAWWKDWTELHIGRTGYSSKWNRVGSAAEWPKDRENIIVPRGRTNDCFKGRGRIEIQEGKKTDQRDMLPLSGLRLKDVGPMGSYEDVKRWCTIRSAVIKFWGFTITGYKNECDAQEKFD
ncbi:hypothetical protein ABEB36_010285 [Hypothenemus hampei]|uniref:Uncharacterized protein n=1 Tax=Hypothenemus hampei TaxID=57062 RepID=A0ABD1EJQ8_HYPHA